MFSNLRIGGLVSGLDTDSIVKDLMRIKRVPVDKLKQNKQILQWQRESYREINVSLRSFRDAVFNMKLQSTYMARSAASSNESAVSASANTSAVQGNYTVTVTQLARGVTIGSQEGLDYLFDEMKEDGTVRTLQEQFGLGDDPVTFTLTGKVSGELKSSDFTIDPTTDTVYTLAAKINSANIGISANYDAGLNRFSLSSASTGSNAYIKVTGDASGLLSDAAGAGDNVLRLKLAGDAEPSVANGQLGRDAIFSFGDMPGLTSASNTVTVNGITLTLKEGGGATSTISVTNDTDAVFNTIKDFVNSYNSLIDKINGKLSETRNRNYLPLTDEQKEEMSEKEIEKWEEFARSGLLRNDGLLNRTVTGMRATLSSIVSGLTGGGGYDSLAKIGITTGLYTEKGKLNINEAKLREALQNDPDGVKELFSKFSEVDEEKGLAQRLYDDVNNGISLVSARAGDESAYSLFDNSNIGKRLSQIDKDIDKLEERLEEIENRYWKQFTALEQAISRMNAQSSWLTQQSASSNQ